jgi:hypothetical protein
MIDKSKETPTPESAPEKRGRGRPRGSKTKPRDPTKTSAPTRPSKPKLIDVERKSWSRAEFCARHGIGSLNTYTAMLKRGDGPEEILLGNGPHAMRRVTLEAEARWEAKQGAKIITEEERAADRQKRATAHAANKAREEQEAAARAPRGKKGRGAPPPDSDQPEGR